MSSLDWHVGRKAVCVENVERDWPEWAHLLKAAGLPVPQVSAVYTVAGMAICSCCGDLVLSFQEIGNRIFFLAVWFRPVEPKEMDVLRGLLAPDGGLPEKVKERVGA